MCAFKINSFAIINGVLCLAAQIFKKKKHAISGSWKADQKKQCEEMSLSETFENFKINKCQNSRPANRHTNGSSGFGSESNELKESKTTQTQQEEIREFSRSHIHTKTHSLTFKSPLLCSKHTLPYVVPPWLQDCTDICLCQGNGDRYGWCLDCTIS